jgi:hypothetical protein
MQVKCVWAYVAATAIVIGMAGGGWFMSKDNSQPVIAQPAAVTQTAPTPRPQKLEPRTIKIHLTLTSPQDLKVKPGDEVTPGQVLSDPLRGSGEASAHLRTPATISTEETATTLP